jgi:hypothetical protein
MRIFGIGAGGSAWGASSLAVWGTLPAAAPVLDVAVALRFSLHDAAKQAKIAAIVRMLARVLTMLPLLHQCERRAASVTQTDRALLGTFIDTRGPDAEDFDGAA